jgi:hypothetical protein
VACAVVALFVLPVCGVARAANDGQVAVSIYQNGSPSLQLIDPDTGAVMSTPLQGPASCGGTTCGGYTDLSFSADGRSIGLSNYGGFFSSGGGSITGQSDGVFILSPSGGVPQALQPALIDPSMSDWASHPAFAQSGDEIAYVWSIYSPTGYTDELRVMHRDSGAVRTVASGLSTWGAEQPTFSADGQTIAYVPLGDPTTPENFGSPSLLAVAAVGGGSPTVLASGNTTDDLITAPSYSPDGMSIAFVRFPSQPGTNPRVQIVIHDLVTRSERVVVDDSLNGPQTIPIHGSVDIAWAPDSKRIAYLQSDSNTSQAQVVTVNTDGTGAKTIFQTPTDTSGSGIYGIAWSRPSAPPVVTLSLSPERITADGRAQATATATVTGNGSPLAGQTVSITSADSGESVGAVSDHGDGTYSATVTASHVVGTRSITATDLSDPAQPSGSATLTQGAPKISLSVKPASIPADGKSTATVTVTLTGVQGEALLGESVSIMVGAPASAGVVINRGNGTYTATVTGHVAGTSTIRASDVSVSPSVSATARLTIKPPPKTCKVPKLKGDTLARAKRALKAANCGIGKVARAKSTAIARGHVISTNPKAGSTHKAATKVHLTISKGAG